jgi:hypothetical protein
VTPKPPTYTESDTDGLPDAWLERGDCLVPLKLHDTSDLIEVDGVLIEGLRAANANEMAARLGPVRKTIAAVAATIRQVERAAAAMRSLPSLPQPETLAAVPSLLLPPATPAAVAMEDEVKWSQELHAQLLRDAPDIARALRDAPDQNDPSLKELRARPPVW